MASCFNGAICVLGFGKAGVIGHCIGGKDRVVPRRAGTSGVRITGRVLLQGVVEVQVFLIGRLREDSV